MNVLVTPKITVLIPTYNCALYVQRAIQSVIDQTEKRWEIILVDDASTDATIDIIDGYRSDKIRIYRNKQNSGQSYSRNLAITEARGEWVAQLDADDWFAPTRLEKLLTIAERTMADLVCDDLRIVEADGTTLRGTKFALQRFRLTSPTFLTPVQLTDYDIGTVKPLMKKSFLLENNIFYDEKVRYGEDYLFLLSCLLCGGRLLAIPESLYSLRRGATGSLTCQRIPLLSQIRESILALLKMERVMQSAELMQSLRKRLSRIETLLSSEQLFQSIKSGDYSAAIMAVSSRPMSLYALLIRVLGASMHRAQRFLYRIT